RVVDTRVLRAADHRISPMARWLAQGWAGPAAGHGTDPAPGDPRVAREIEPLAADDALHVPVGLPLSVTARRCQALQLVSGAVALRSRNTQLGWHRNVPEFEVVIGLSLGATARM